MNTGKILVTLAATLCVTTGCSKKNTNPWDESKSSSSVHKRDGLPWGDDEFEGDLAGPLEEDFVPLQEEDLKSQLSDGAIPQAKLVPGEEGSGIPGIDQFSTPSAELAAIFRSVYFNTDDHILRGKESVATIDRIANFLQEHPNLYIFVSGHCDERGPEAYNLSLGARRANYVRSLLVERGVDLNRLFTISYGKEKPADFSHTAQGWSKNRRAEFRIYEK